MSKTLTEKQRLAVIRKNEGKVLTVERKNIRKNIVRNGGRF